MSRQFFLIRHGAAEDGAGQRFIGHTDLPLSEKGREQARRLRIFLAEQTISQAFCSDLSRCRGTAEIIIDGSNIPLTARGDLREPSMGAWEGRLREDIACEFPDDYHARGRNPENFKVAGGETFRDCLERVVPAFGDIVGTTDGDVLLVGHGSVNRILLCHLLGMPMANMFRLGQDHGCVNVLRKDQSGYRLTLLNSVP
jgi:probable phosphoglycerate mutase